MDPVRLSPYLTLYPIDEKCRGFEDETCDKAPTYAIALAEEVEGGAIDITVNWVCGHHAQLWQTYFVKRGEA